METTRRQEYKGESMYEEATVDWRGRPSNPNKHGGMRAAAFVLGLLSLSLSLDTIFESNCPETVSSPASFSSPSDKMKIRKWVVLSS